MFKVQIYNEFDPFYRYPLNIGLGYWFSGVRWDTAGKPIEINRTKFIQSLLDSLSLIAKNSGDSFISILNDCSPVKVEEGAFLEASCNKPLVVINLTSNQGCGHKENILQYLSYLFSDYFFRFDADVKFSKSPLDVLKKSFSDIPNLGMAVINAGFLGAMICGRKDSPEYVKVTGSVGNGCMIPTKVFQFVGYSDPMLRYFDDIDMATRIYSKGYKIVMVRDAKGSTIQSGTGVDPPAKAFFATYLENSNPTIKVIYNKNGKPIMRWQSVAFAHSRVLSPTPWAIGIALKVKEETKSDIVLLMRRK